MIADSAAFLAVNTTELIYDAEHFFDGFKRNPDYALSTLQAAAEFRRLLARSLRHQWRRLCPRKSPPPSRLFDRSIRVPIGIHTHNDCDLAVGEHSRRREARAQPRCKGRSTASASAAGTSTYAA